MQTDCISGQLEFEGFDGHKVVAGFDGGAITSDAGALLLRHVDGAISLFDRVAGCFIDGRNPDCTVHSLRTLIGQRIAAIALGYEDVDDHDTLRHDPVLALLSESLTPKREDCAVLAGKSTLNRLELGRSRGADALSQDRLRCSRRSKLCSWICSWRPIDKPPAEIVLDLDATDDPLHGHQEGRFFHGYYNCYCYLPLYVFCGRHLLAAKLRRSNIDASKGAVEEVERIVTQIRRKWSKVRIVLRADSGFAREALMAWCEANRVDYVFGLARNERLEKKIAAAMKEAGRASRASGQAARRVPRLHVVDEGQLVTPQKGRGKGRMDDAGCQSALHRDLAQAGPLDGTGALRGTLLRPRRHGEPNQGMPARPLRRSHLAPTPCAPISCGSGSPRLPMS